MLCTISEFCKGNFYYIKNVKVIEECFAACLGIVMSAFAKNVRIELDAQTGAAIKNTFGPEWSTPVGQPAAVAINTLSFENKKYYICNLLIKKVPFSAPEIVVAKGKLVFTIDGIPFSLEDSLVLKIVDSEKELGEENQEVVDQVIRVEAAETLEKAKEHMDKGRETEAMELLDAFNAYLKVAKCSNDKKVYYKKVMSKEVMKSKKEMAQYQNNMHRQEYVSGMLNMAAPTCMQTRMIKRCKKY